MKKNLKEGPGAGYLVNAEVSLGKKFSNIIINDISVNKYSEVVFDITLDNEDMTIEGKVEGYDWGDSFEEEGSIRLNGKVLYASFSDYLKDLFGFIYEDIKKDVTLLYFDLYEREVIEEPIENIDEYIEEMFFNETEKLLVPAIKAYSEKIVNSLNKNNNVISSFKLRLRGSSFRVNKVFGSGYTWGGVPDIFDFEEKNISPSDYSEFDEVDFMQVESKNLTELIEDLHDNRDNDLEENSMKKNLKEANQYTLGSEFGLDDVVDDIYGAYGKMYSTKEVEKAVEAYVDDIYEDFNRRNHKAIDTVDIAKDLVKLMGDVYPMPGETLENLIVHFIESFDELEDNEIIAFDLEALKNIWQETIDEILLDPLVNYIKAENELYTSEEYLEESWQDNAYIAFESPFAFTEYEKLPQEVLDDLTENNLTMEDLDDWISDKGNSDLKVYTEITDRYRGKDLDKAIVLWSSPLGQDEAQVDGLDDVIANLTEEQEEYVENQAGRGGAYYKGDYLILDLSDTTVTFYIEWDDIKKDFLKDMADR